MKRYFTSESVSEGHPDKMADQISDAVLDSVLAQDPHGKVACETLLTTGLIVVAGEMATQAKIDIPTIARNVVRDVGYNSSDAGFDAETCGVMVAMGAQSPDIAMGVNKSSPQEQGAGDQGLMFGYATDESPELMPLSILLSHRLVQRLAALRKGGAAPFLRPDSKSQITVEYEGDNVSRIDTVVISTQHVADVSQKEIKSFVVEELIKKNIPEELLDDQTRFFVNPTGRFVVGGPKGDAGLTGRKIIVDTYGGHGAHGGGAFSGKDPSKVDRSSAYAARHVAKNIVASELAKRCLVQVAYAIGVAEPVSISVNCFGTGAVGSARLGQLVQELWDLRPGSIVERYDLLKPIYRQTATYGHFGRDDLNVSWEKLDMVGELKRAASRL